MKVLSVVETATYVDNLDAAEEFYHHVLGLDVIFREPSQTHVTESVQGMDTLCPQLAFPS
jgi:catechol 2,3-dioxygenase-like lactoylglutathione lyase family enzyme